MRALDRHLKNLENKHHVWTLNEINSVRKCLHGLRDHSEAWNLLQELNECGFSRQITAEQSIFGINWLRDTVFKANGSLRDTHASRCFTAEHVEMIKHFDHFTFEGVKSSGSPGENINTSPIYRLYDTDGDYFDYTVPFGGLPEVLFTHSTKQPPLPDNILDFAEFKRRRSA